MTTAFFDSNILIYALEEGRKGEIARRLLDQGGQISVQSLNEFANVTRKKLKYDWQAIGRLTSALRERLPPVAPLTDELHAEAIRLAQLYTISFYDALIVAAALRAGCTTLFSEDMHAGLVIDGRLTITNPFA